MLRGKERKKRKQELILKVKIEVDEEDLYTLKIGVFLFCFVFYSGNFFFNIIFQPLSYISAIHIFISLKNVILVIYFWLSWVFVTVQAFLQLQREGAPLYLRCTGFSLQGLFLWSMDSRARELQSLQHAGSLGESPGLLSTGSVAMAHGLSCSEACGSSWNGK